MRQNPKSSKTATEAKRRFCEEPSITRDDKPVAVIAPVQNQDLAQVQTAVAQLKALRTKLQDRTRREKALTDAEVRSAIAEGRR
jgi:antitoxin (DNA-binding transcriptional repressor) of toxin-antitoxin stability system